jgi:hypothetical protein
MVREAGLFDLDKRRRKLSEVGDPLVRLRQYRLQRDPDALAAPANRAAETVNSLLTILCQLSPNGNSDATS